MGLLLGLFYHKISKKGIPPAPSAPLIPDSFFTIHEKTQYPHPFSAFQPVIQSAFCKRLPAGPSFLARARKEGKLSRLRGEQLAPARIVPPLRIPRVEPSGIDPSPWLGVVGFTPCPRFGLWFLGVSLSHAVDWKIEKNRYHTIERYRAWEGQ